MFFIGRCRVWNLFQALFCLVGSSLAHLFTLDQAVFLYEGLSPTLPLYIIRRHFHHTSSIIHDTSPIYLPYTYHLPISPVLLEISHLIIHLPSYISHLISPISPLISHLSSSIFHFQSYLCLI